MSQRTYQQFRSEREGGKEKYFGEEGAKESEDRKDRAQVTY